MYNPTKSGVVTFQNLAPLSDEDRMGVIHDDSHSKTSFCTIVGNRKAYHMSSLGPESNSTFGLYFGELAGANARK